MLIKSNLLLKIYLVILLIISIITGLHLTNSMTTSMLIFWDNIEDILPFIKYILLILNFLSVSVFTFTLGILFLVVIKRINTK